MVVGDAHLHKMVDNSDRVRQRPGAVQARHTIPALLQLPRRLSKITSELSPAQLSEKPTIC